MTVEKITEREHVDNLLYIRDVLKHRISQIVKNDKAGGSYLKPKAFNELVEALKNTEACLGDLYSKLEVLKK